MYKFVSFKTVGLREPRMANVTLVRLLSSVYPEMAFQFERIRAGVSAMWTLVGSLARMATDVAFQFRQFHASVIAFGALVGLLVCMSISYVAHQFARSGKSGIAILARVRFGSGMRIDVVLQRRQCLEPPFTHATLVWPLLRVRLHMPR